MNRNAPYHKKPVNVTGCELRLQGVAYNQPVMEAAIFRERASCSKYVNQRFERTYHLHLQGKKSVEQETSV
jgi:hypothetical protein